MQIKLNNEKHSDSKYGLIGIMKKLLQDYERNHIIIYRGYQFDYLLFYLFIFSIVIFCSFVNFQFLFVLLVKNTD